MRSTVAAYFVLASLLGLGTAAAAACPEGALGTSRTIVVDPTEHARLGAFQYRESLPLQNKEVVLTFDDGPLPPYTTRILDTLASECVKATFFMVGRMVRGYPSIVRRVYNEGHTVANHSQNHPFTFHKMTVAQASQEIEDGFTSLQTALGDPKAVAPFFRIPGLLRQEPVEHYLASRGYMTWSVDFLADDWTHIKAEEIARRAIDRMEARGRGIMLLHDIQPATALALPIILGELKARGYKVVHVLPATPDRPKTVTEPEQWVLRGTAPRPQFWPRVVAVGPESTAPVLPAPSPANFGVAQSRVGSVKVALASNFDDSRGLVPFAAAGGSVKVALTSNFDGSPTPEGETLLPPAAAWPRRVSYSVPAEADVLPVPGLHNFRYSRVFKLPSPDKPKLAARKPTTPTTPWSTTTSTQPKPKDPSATGGIAGMLNGPRPPRPVGHQLTVFRPPFSLSPPTGIR